EFFELGVQTLAWQFLQRLRRAQRLRRGVNVEFKARRELYGTQGAQGVLGEGGRDVAQQAGLKIRAAAVAVDQFEVGQAQAHGVDREITPRRCGREVQVRVGRHVEPAVALAYLFFGARERDVVNRPVAQRHGDHTEGLAHQVRLPVFFQDGQQRVEREPVYFDVIIVAGQACQVVA